MREKESIEKFLDMNVIEEVIIWVAVSNANLNLE